MAGTPRGRSKPAVKDTDTDTSTTEAQDTEPQAGAAQSTAPADQPTEKPAEGVTNPNAQLMGGVSGHTLLGEDGAHRGDSEPDPEKAPADHVAYTRDPIANRPGGKGREFEDPNQESGSVPDEIARTTVQPIAAPIAPGVTPEPTPAPFLTPVATHVQPTHRGVVDVDGNAIDLSTAFQKETETGNTVRVTRRLYEYVTLPGTDKLGKKLLFPEGAILPADQAAQLAESASAAQSDQD